jgi:hypothetical protein
MQSKQRQGPSCGKITFTRQSTVQYSQQYTKANAKQYTKQCMYLSSTQHPECLVNHLIRLLKTHICAGVSVGARTTVGLAAAQGSTGT